MQRRVDQLDHRTANISELIISDKDTTRLVRTPGLEPGRDYSQGILSPLRLPFRHVRVATHPAPNLGITRDRNLNRAQVGDSRLARASAEPRAARKFSPVTGGPRPATSPCRRSR